MENQSHKLFADFSFCFFGLDHVMCDFNYVLQFALDMFAGNSGSSTQYPRFMTLVSWLHTRVIDPKPLESRPSTPDFVPGVIDPKLLESRPRLHAPYQGRRTITFGFTYQMIGSCSAVICTTCTTIFQIVDPRTLTLSLDPIDLEFL